MPHSAHRRKHIYKQHGRCSLPGRLRPKRHDGRSAHTYAIIVSPARCQAVVKRSLAPHRDAGRIGHTRKEEKEAIHGCLCCRVAGALLLKTFDTFPWEAYTFLVATIERPKPELKALLEANGYKYLCDHGGFRVELWVHETLPNGPPQAAASLDTSETSRPVCGANAASAVPGPPGSLCWTGHAPKTRTVFPRSTKEEIISTLSSHVTLRLLLSRRVGEAPINNTCSFFSLCSMV